MARATTMPKISTRFKKFNIGYDCGAYKKSRPYDFTPSLAGVPADNVQGSRHDATHTKGSKSNLSVWTDAILTVGLETILYQHRYTNFPHNSTMFPPLGPQLTSLSEISLNNVMIAEPFDTRIPLQTKIEQHVVVNASEALHGATRPSV